MSSNDEDYAQESHRGKKRRLQRACDVCRRRKSRCDGSQVPGDKCTTCIDANLECTYIESTAKRPPPKSYVDSLESRLEHSEALVRQLRAELASTHFAKSSPTSSPSSNSDCPSGGNKDPPPTKNLDGSTASLYIMRTALRSLAAPPPPPNAEDLEHVEIVRKLEKLSVGPMREHFIGKSSGAMLVKAAIDLKADVKREEKAEALGRSPEVSSDDRAETGDREDDGVSWTSRRLQYWQWKPWENNARRTYAFKFPSEALTSHLIDLYFTHQNIYLPLLHRPTFERGVREGLHLRDDGFAATLLLVCAIGSRWSTSPTIVGAGLSRGWEWFDQVPLVGSHLFGQATLYDLQYYCLAVMFLDGSSAPQACWTLIGVGLRLAQDIGVHRRKAHIEVPTVQSELYKRAFWVLVYLDRVISSGMGRTCAVHYDESTSFARPASFDIDPPIECDDEFWEHPTRPFEQHPGIPSQVTFFNTLMRLNHILSFSLKILYSLNKVRVFYSVNDAWEESAVAELDSSLNNWRDRIPEHLRWNPSRREQVFFDQSVALHCAYYHLQILIHRPFIPMLRKSAPTALPSLAICTSAARACANIVDVQRQRNGNVPAVINLPSVFTSAIVLLLNVWSGKRTGLVPDPSREMTNVHKCMEVVRLCEDRWQAAGLFWDILAELASVGQLPLPNGTNLNGPQVSGPTLPPVRGDCYPSCVYPLDEETASRISLGSRGLRQTFDRPIHDPQFRAPYAHLASASFAGQIGGKTGTFGPSPMEPSAFAPAPAPATWSAPRDPFEEMYTDPSQASQELGDMLKLIDSDTIAMWTNAPMGVEVDDWGTYFSSFSEITQGQQTPQVDMAINGTNTH
ncbi:fungal-specific transcription factor domain-containing protein [Mycena haematopus]|nr:fungal-specific transcription factor domain-containing protein [Mycena haematopus]